jgi:hypothetical protein
MIIFQRAKEWFLSSLQSAIAVCKSKSVAWGVKSEGKHAIATMSLIFTVKLND